jgi:iduronate 2-sulfatase
LKKDKISRRRFLNKVGAGALAAPIAPMIVSGAPGRGSASSTSVFPAIASGSTRKRNVLFISTDDCCNRLGVYGHPIVKTPNLHRLARSGVRFDRAYDQYPLCSPSRSSLMTGLAPDTTRVWDNQTHFRHALPDVVTLPQTFLKNGYFTARVGKVYHYGNPSQIGTSGLDDPPSWNETMNPAGVEHTKEEAQIANLTPSRRFHFRRHLPGQGQGISASPGAGSQSPQRRGPGGARGRGRGGWPGLEDPVGAEVPGNDGWGATIALHESESNPEFHTDYLVADAVIGMLENRKKQPNDPWFLGAGFYKPHVPWAVPSEYFDMYPLDQIEATPFDESEMHIAPEWAYFTKPANWGMTVRQRREAIRAYYAAAGFLDANIGRILDALERLGLAQDTTVVFWADHGYQLGEHGQWMKQTLFEPAARVPLIIGGTGVSAAGRACPRTVEHLDIYPTLVELCGLQGAPSNLHGKSLAPLLANPNADWDRPAISQVFRSRTPYGVVRYQNGPSDGVMGYSLRTERYRYTLWKERSEGEELYDYQVDPRELRNLANDSSLADMKAKLRASLERICRERGMANAPGALRQS